MSLETPSVNYKSIKINGKDILLSGTCRASFNAPYNQIDFIIRPTNCSLSYYEIRVTGKDDDYDIGVGNLAYYMTNVSAATDTSFSISVNSTIFNKGDGTYRISLYARSSVDDSWDVTYLFFTLTDDGSEQFVPSDSDGYEVLTTREEPQN